MTYTNIQSLICVFLAAVCGIILLMAKVRIDALESENAALESTLKANEQALSEAKAELIKMDALLLEREALLHEVEDEAEKLSRGLRDATAKGKAADWASTALPDDIARLFAGADSSDGDRQDKAAAGSAPAAGRAQVEGPDK